MGREIFFNFPQAAFLLIILVPILACQILLLFYRKKQLKAYASKQTLNRLLIPRSSLYTLTKMAGWSLIWILACAALMEPFGNIRYPSLPEQAHSP